MAPEIVIDWLINWLIDRRAEEEEEEGREEEEEENISRRRDYAKRCSLYL